MFTKELGKQSKMNEGLPQLINVPPFMLRGIQYDDLSKASKILFILKGRFLSYIIKNTNEGLFCFFINLFYSSEGKLEYKTGRYVFNTYQGKSFSYPNKRVLRVVGKYNMTFTKILKSYCIDLIHFEKKDIVIDCGANVGEINLALKELGVKIDYFAFEPDLETFKCLNLNNPNSSLYNIGLSNKNAESKLFIDNEGGNSSFSNFGTEEYINVESKSLDSFKFAKDIKLLKIDAEGYEPEVLEGAVETLKNIEFVSVDYGAERGIMQETTIVDVNTFLYENNFKLYKFSNHRLIGLYKNNKK